MAASTYGSYEFWPGPLDAAGNPPSDCTLFDKIWEITTEDFKMYDREGIISDNLRNWPWDLGAPVVDGDGNRDNYNLSGGDRPELLGDQTLWWIMNDRGNQHEWSEAHAIGLEVHVSAFAFQNPKIGGDISFYRYRLINKNINPLNEAYLSMWVDSELGNASDDYVGSDSLLHLGYTYNADNDDDNGYGIAPPALGYTFLKTPQAPIDGLDNDRDGVIDEPGESVGLSSAIAINKGTTGPPFGDPFGGESMYNYMKGLTFNGETITLGGNFNDFSDIPTRFMYPGDPVTGSFWTEIDPYMGSTIAPNPPSDRRFMVSGGPFTLLSGASTDFVVAIVWAKGKDHLDSVQKLKGIVSNMQDTPERFLTSGYRPELTESSGEFPQQEVLGFSQNFPNPFTGITTFSYSLPKEMDIRLAVYDVLGREVELLVEGTQEAGVYTIDFDGTSLQTGMYFARLELDHLQFTKKMIRLF